MMDWAFPMYQDADFDGFGDVDVIVEACQTEPGLSSVHGDCDDSMLRSVPMPTRCVMRSTTLRMVMLMRALNKSTTLMLMEMDLEMAMCFRKPGEILATLRTRMTVTI